MVVMNHALHEFHVGIGEVIVVKGRDARDDGRRLPGRAGLHNRLSGGPCRRRLAGRIAAGVVAGSTQATGYGQREDRERAMTAGFDYHFVKPTNPGQIQRAIELGRHAGDAIDAAQRGAH